MIFALDPAAASESVLMQVTGGSQVAQLTQVDGEVIGGIQGAGMVLA